MSIKNLRGHQLSVEFHHEVVKARFPGYLRNQVLRTSASITLNLGVRTSKVQNRLNRRNRSRKTSMRSSSLTQAVMTPRRRQR